MDDTSSSTTPSKGRRRFLWSWRGLVLVLVGGPVLAVLIGVVALSQRPIAMPDALERRIEARINAAMVTNDVQIGTIRVSLEASRFAPVVTFEDIVMRDPDGAPRARVPSVAVQIDGRALVRGEIRPLSVDVGDAGLILRRDADGQIDLVLSNDAAAVELSLDESLGRLDAMFASPVFAGLDTVTGSRISVAMADTMTGQIIRLSNGRMRLARSDEGLTLTLGGALEGSRNATLDIAINRSAAEGRTNVGFAFTNLAARDLATAAPALRWLELARAPISGFLSLQLSDNGRVGDMRGSLQIGAGQVALAGTQPPLTFDAITAALHYDADRQRLFLDQVDLAAAALSFRAVGHADVAETADVFVGQFRLSDIQVDLEDRMEAPIRFDGAALDMRLALGPEVSIEIGQALLYDDSIQIEGRGEILARDDGLDLAVDAHLDEIQAHALFDYWPTEAIPRTRTWLDANLRGGRLTGVEFSLRQAAGDLPESHLSLDFYDLDLRALPDMPPIHQGAGYLSVTNGRLVMRLDEGEMTAPGGGSVSLAGSTMQGSDTRVPRSMAHYDLALDGGVRDLLSLLEAPPVSLFRDGAMTTDRVGTGRIRANVTIAARLGPRQEGPIAPGEVDFEVSGDVVGFQSDDLLPGRRFAADRLQLSVTPERIRIAGAATLDGVPLAGQWSRALGRDADPTSLITARARLSRPGLTALGVALPGWLMGGETQADISLTLHPERPGQLVVESDLEGLSLSIPQLGWGLSRAQTGALRADVTLGPEPRVDLLEVAGEGLTFRGSVAAAGGPGRARVTAEEFRIGRWLNVTGQLTGRGVGEAPAIDIRGGTVDLSGAPQGRGGSGSGQIARAPLNVQLDRLQIGNGIALTGVRAELSSGAGLEGPFRAQVNGAADIMGTLFQTDSGQAVQLRAADGGAVLRAAGLFQRAYGGEMELTLNASGQDRTYNGLLTIDGPRLRGAPAMAELLNLISVVGLLEQLSGEGINLGDVEARFRLSPTRLVVQEGAAVGPSMGISLDGVYDLGSSQLDMQGVVSPLYIVNGLLGGLFAARGEGLFGFAYRLTGQADAPQVTVNPLSILTPGIFRDIFRRPPPDLSDTQ